VRVIGFQRFTGIPASGQLGTLALERLLDLFVLLIFLFATLGVLETEVLTGPLLHGLRIAAGAVALAIIIFLAAPRSLRLIVAWAAERLPRLRRAGAGLLRLSDALVILSRPMFLLRVMALSIAGWLFEGAAFLAVGHALGIATEPEAALLALSVGTLSTVIPSSPGYVGTFHYFTAQALSGYGASDVSATAYAILIHAVLWISTTTVGFFLLAIASVRRVREPDPIRFDIADS
jgi:uncharacterized membrane protein YbhN (UPF0104 family)